jgi:hypothetical protein
MLISTPWDNTPKKEHHPQQHLECSEYQYQCV